MYRIDSGAGCCCLLGKINLFFCRCLHWLCMLTSVCDFMRPKSGFYTVEPAHTQTVWLTLSPACHIQPKQVHATHPPPFLPATSRCGGQMSEVWAHMMHPRLSAERDLGTPQSSLHRHTPIVMLLNLVRVAPATVHHLAHAFAACRIAMWLPLVFVDCLV